MFLSTILLALIVGALAGGGIPRLADLKLRWTALLIVALALRLAARYNARHAPGDVAQAACPRLWDNPAPAAPT